MLNHLDYRNELATRYGEVGTDLDVGRKLHILHQELLRHIEVFRDAINHIRSVDSSVTQDLFDGYQSVVDLLSEKIEFLEDW